MPKHVTIHAPWDQLTVAMIREDVSELMIHQHFTNIQHSLRLAHQVLASQDTPNRQIVLITDWLPTVHFEDNLLYILFPPHSPRLQPCEKGHCVPAIESRSTLSLFRTDLSRKKTSDSPVD
jgi:uncharacterized protein with von Willebrand factor type A (vWA) domain